MTRSVLLATLFGVAETHLRANTPESGDDFLEEFIEHHPDDEALSVPSLPSWTNFTSRNGGNPVMNSAAGRVIRRSRGALLPNGIWRGAELRLGHRDAALQPFRNLRADHPALPELAPAFLENAQLLLADRQFDAAKDALEAARSLRPSAEMEDQIAFLSGRIDYAGGKFDAAAKNFQRIALASKKHANDALLNASFAALRAGDGAQFALVSQELKERRRRRIDAGRRRARASADAGRARRKECRGFIAQFHHQFPETSAHFRSVGGTGGIVVSCCAPARWMRRART